MLRAIVFYPRIWITNKLLRWNLRWGNEYTPTKEGVEVKFACEAAEASGAKLGFLDNEMST
jgi:hypothetical protein